MRLATEVKSAADSADEDGEILRRDRAAHVGQLLPCPWIVRKTRRIRRWDEELMARKAGALLWGAVSCLGRKTKGPLSGLWDVQNSVQAAGLF